MNSNSLKALVALGLAFTLTQCKTPGTGSAVKAEGDVSDGLNTNAGDAKARANWAHRMGIRFAEGEAKVEAVMPAHFAQSVGVSKGDLVVALNGKAVSSPDSFEQVAKTFTGLGNEAKEWNGIWIVKVQRGDEQYDLQSAKEFDCDPYVLIGCGPLNE